MEQSDPFKPCGRRLQHDAWALHFLGYLQAAPEPAVRKAVVEALAAAADSWELPVAVVSIWCDLMDQDLSDDADF